MTGYERPFIIGLSGTLRCSTILNVITITWYKTDVDTVLESSSSSTVELVLSPNSKGLDGMLFTCRAVTVCGEVHNETVAIEVKGTCIHLELLIMSKSSAFGLANL